jgi:CMP-2-keto-3-deoxyoctulosonic acid synthetase
MSDNGFHVVIPRFASSRFPGKALALAADSVSLEHVWRQARQSHAADVVDRHGRRADRPAGRDMGADGADDARSHRSGPTRSGGWQVRAGRTMRSS